MSLSDRLLICRDPRAGVWHLGALQRAEGRSVLLSWEGAPRVDAGVPATIGDVLAAGLARVARVTYLATAGHRTIPTEWTLVDRERGEYARTLATPSPTGRWRSAWSGEPAALSVRSAQRADGVQPCFSQLEYPWEQQGQVVLLSELHGDLPRVTRDAVLALFEDGWVTALDRLGPAGVTGVMRPGVDGDVAVIACSSARQREELIRAMQDAARQAAVEAIEIAEEHLLVA
ncbi:MAG: hypothetical protein MUF00_05660 [Gemmatimonadaceae bacterium]|nr:hypothetical protein [Gemmatimonadaceae bacterium]